MLGVGGGGRVLVARRVAVAVTAQSPGRRPLGRAGAAGRCRAVLAVIESEVVLAGAEILLDRPTHPATRTSTARVAGEPPRL
jgi:hypothetical protein